MRAFPVFILLVLGCSHVAFGWSAAGHKIIGSIAFRQLSRSEQIRVVAILKQHPRFTKDFSDAMPEEIASGTEEMQDEWLFHQAAIWPDIVRPPGPSAQIGFHRSTWHYINVPHFLDGPSRIELSGSVDPNLALDPPNDATLDTADLNVVQVIRLARQTCADDTADAANRAVLMAWLFHNVGEAQSKAAELKLRAERKAGELLAGLNLRGGDPKSNGHDDRLILADLGINQTQSKRWQKEAAVPEAEFVQYVERAGQLGEEVTAAGLLRLSRKGSGTAVSRRTNALQQEHQEALPPKPIVRLQEIPVPRNGCSDQEVTDIERAEQLDLVQEISVTRRSPQEEV